MAETNGTTGWRWTIGILLSIQGAIIGWLAYQVGDLRQQIYEEGGKSTRALLEERTNTWVPVIIENRVEITKLDKELSRLDYRISRLEGNGR